MVVHHVGGCCSLTFFTFLIVGQDRSIDRIMHFMLVGKACREKENQTGLNWQYYHLSWFSFSSQLICNYFPSFNTNIQPILNAYKVAYSRWTKSSYRDIGKSLNNLRFPVSFSSCLDPVPHWIDAIQKFSRKIFRRQILNWNCLNHSNLFVQILSGRRCSLYLGI